jgi:putative secretion ATPase (PEP-CTERM system associated)
MYEAFYGLTGKPFNLNPDPSFYFGSKQHRRAKAYLDYGVARNEGFIVITGEIGVGKTTILRSLLDSLRRADVVVGHLVTTQLDAEDTLRMVGAAFGFLVKDVPKSQLLITLEAFLLGQVNQGKRCLLIVDEAQNLTPRAVEELRMLSNFQLGTQSLLQSFLVGQPEFREILQRPEMEQFRQRVAATCHIGPMDQEETRAYIEHRLKCAGSTGKPEFEPAAFEAVHRASNGIPRRINAICDRLLLLGFLANKTILSADDVNEVVHEFAREAEVPRKTVVAGRVDRLERLDSGFDGADAPDSANGALDGALDVDLSQRRLDPQVARELTDLIDTAAAGQHAESLQRLERSVLRLERLNLRTLTMLKQLVKAVEKPPEESSS